MHPALSVIVFTTLSGAGYGLLFLIGVLSGTAVLPESRWFGLVALGLSLGLASIGLVASTFHLGHPERAWRAFSQWRSSWLSREGVASTVTYIPALVLWIAWLTPAASEQLIAVAGIVTSIMTFVTVCC